MIGIIFNNLFPGVGDKTEFDDVTSGGHCVKRKIAVEISVRYNVGAFDANFHTGQLFIGIAVGNFTADLHHYYIIGNAPGKYTVKCEQAGNNKEQLFHVQI